MLKLWNALTIALLWIILEAPQFSFSQAQNAHSSIAAGYGFTCALNFGRVKCWGENRWGNLGLGHTNQLGHAPNQMGTNLPFVDLGTGQNATEIAVSMTTSAVTNYATHACALLQGGQVKCWGANTYGQLGQGHTNSLGDAPNEMGDNLPPIDLGTGRTAVQITLGESHTCALLDNGKAKCWGRNDKGQLGLGDTNHRGNDPNEMGDNLAYVNMISAPGRSIVEIKAGGVHTCARLDNGQICCWGSNDHYRVNNRVSGQQNIMQCFNMYGRTALKLALGAEHTCALLKILEYLFLVCWGENSRRQTGNPEYYDTDYATTYYAYGWREAVHLGDVSTVKDIAAGGYHSCAIFENGKIKCWGSNYWGQAGQANTNYGGTSVTSPIGKSADQMGNNLPFVSLGTGQTVAELALSGTSTCARLDTWEVKCWGHPLGGQLGKGNLDQMGHSNANFGDNLKIVKINDCGILACGQHSQCVEYSTSRDMGCKCDELYFYDAFTFRNVREITDVIRTTRVETRKCRSLSEEVLLQVSNMGVRFKINMNPSVNTSVSIGLTNRQLNPILFGPPFALPNQGIYPGNQTYSYQLQNVGRYQYNGQEFYLTAKLIPDNRTVVDTRFVLPCGCDAHSFLDFPPEFPRRDDGRPSDPQAIQRKGKIYPSWTDNSVCATQFSLYRIVPGSSLLAALNAQPFQENELFDKGDFIQELIKPGGNEHGVQIKSVISDFVQEASNCYSRYDSLQFYDDVAQAGIAVGTRLFYCMIASETSLRYTSGYSCVTDTTVQWEATMKVRISAGKTSLPSVGVNVTWEARVPMNDSSEDGVAFLSGTGVTDRDGSFSFYVVGDPRVYPQIASLTRIPIALWFSKTSQVSESEVIDHVFMCDGGVRPCTVEDPQIVELAVFSFGETVSQIEDATVIPIRGKVTVKGTEIPGYEEGCPVPAVEICLRAPPANDEAYSYGCIYTDSLGNYALAAPIGSVIVPTAKYHNHTFERSGPFALQAVFKIRTQAIDGVDFKDTTTETLYVDVVGGLCNISIAENVTVTLTRNAEIGCSNWRRHHLLTKLSPTRFSAIVPATYYEIRITPTSEAGYPEGGVQAIAPLVSYVVSDELDKPFRDGLLPLLEVNLTNIEGDFNLTSDDYIIPRLARFQYNPDVTMNLILTQGELDEVVGTPTSCSSAQVQVVQADYNNPVNFNMNFTQNFGTNDTCSTVRGSVKVQMNTWSKSTSEFVEYPVTFVEDPITNQISHTTVVISAPMQPNPMPTPGSEYMRFITVEYSEGPGFSVQSFVTKFIVVGHYTDDESKFQSVPIVFDPIAIVRDPPGDGSYATYTNVESAVTYSSEVYDVYHGMTSDNSLTAGPKVDAETCVGLGLTLCKKLLDIYRGVALKTTRKGPATQRVTSSKNSFTRHLTWSFQTPGYSDAKIPFMLPGPMSDMFLVPIEIVSFFDTFRISQNSSCAAQRSERIITFTLPEDNSGGIGWYSRYDITSRIIPNLELLVLQAEDDERDYLDGALQRWSQMIEDSPDTLSAFEKLLIKIVLKLLRNSELANVLGVAQDAMRLLDDADWAKMDEEMDSSEDRRLSDAASNEVAVKHERLLNEFVDSVTVDDSRKKWLRRKWREFSLRANNTAKWKGSPTQLFIGVFSVDAKLVPIASAVADVIITVATAGVVEAGYEQLRNEPVTEWNPIHSVFLKDQFHPLPSKPSLWSSQEDWDNEQRKAAASSVISFSGGGSQVRVEISDEFTGEKGQTIAHHLSGSLSLGYDVRVDIGPLGFHQEANLGYEFAGQNSLITATVTTRISEASFVLSDSTAGDYFDVQITRDLRYGTFAFNTTGGASSCPVEPNTASREKPKISSRPGDSGTAIVHPDAPAYFHLSLENWAADLSSFSTFELVADLKNLKDSFRVYVNGMLMDHPIVFETIYAMTSYPILLEVHRGAELFDVEFSIQLRSMCQWNLGEYYPIQVHFAKPCASIELVGALSTGETKYILGDEDQHPPNPLLISLNVRRPLGSPYSAIPWANISHVTSAKLKYSTLPSGSFDSNVPDGDIREANGAPILWELSGYPKESVFYVRAEVTCSPNGFDAAVYPELFKSVSSIGIIRIDHVRPVVFHIEPQGAVFPGESVAEISFSEVLQCGIPHSFTAMVTFVGKDPPGPLIASPNNKALFVRCVENTISISLSYGLQDGKLHKSDVAGRKAIITLQYVRDAAGNLAFSNVAGLPFGIIQHSFEFEPVNPFHTWFKVTGLIVHNVDMDADLEKHVLESLMNVLPINDTRVRILHVSVLDGQSNSALADLTISPGGVVIEDLVKVFNESVMAHPNFEFAVNGGIDILYDDRTHSRAGAFDGQCDSSALTLDVAVVDAKVDATSSKVNAIESQIQSIESKVDGLSMILVEILDRLNNHTVSAQEYGSPQSQDAQGSAANENSVLSPSSTAAILAVGALVGLVAVLTLVGLGFLYRRHQQHRARTMAASQIRRTGDFVVSGANPQFSSRASKELVVTSYNPVHSPHPVFSDADA